MLSKPVLSRAASKAFTALLHFGTLEDDATQAPLTRLREREFDVRMGPTSAD